MDPRLRGDDANRWHDAAATVSNSGLPQACLPIGGLPAVRVSAIGLPANRRPCIRSPIVLILIRRILILISFIAAIAAQPAALQLRLDRHRLGAFTKLQVE